VTVLSKPCGPVISTRTAGTIRDVPDAFTAPTAESYARRLLLFPYPLLSGNH